MMAPMMPAPALSPAGRILRKPPGYERLPEDIQRWKRPGELRLERPKAYALAATTRSAIQHKCIELIELYTASHPDRPEYARITNQQFHAFCGGKTAGRGAVTMRAVEIALRELEQEKGFVGREFADRERKKGGYRNLWDTILTAQDAPAPKPRLPKNSSVPQPKNSSVTADARNRKTVRLEPTADAIATAMQCGNASGCPLLCYARGIQSVVVANGGSDSPVQETTPDTHVFPVPATNTSIPVDGCWIGNIPDSSPGEPPAYLAEFPNTYSAGSTSRVFSSEFHPLPDRTGEFTHTSERMGEAVSNAESSTCGVSHAPERIGETAGAGRFTESLVPASDFTHSPAAMGESVTAAESTACGVSHSSTPMGETTSSPFHLLPEATGEATADAGERARETPDAAGARSSGFTHAIGETPAGGFTPTAVPMGETASPPVSLQRKYRTGETREGAPAAARDGGALANYRKMGKKSGGVYREKIGERIPDPEPPSAANSPHDKTDKTPEPAEPAVSNQPLAAKLTGQHPDGANGYVTANSSGNPDGEPPSVASCQQAPDDMTPADFAAAIGRVFHLGGKALPTEKQAAAAAAKLASRSERRDAFAEWADREKLATGAVRRAWGPGILDDWVSEFFVYQNVNRKLEADRAEADRAMAEAAEQRRAEWEAEARARDEAAEREAASPKPPPEPPVCYKCRGSGALYNRPDPDDYTPCSCAAGRVLKAAREQRNAGES